MTFPELETDRLRLVEVTTEHVQGVFDNFSNPSGPPILRNGSDD